MAGKVAAPAARGRTMSDEHKAALAEGREHGRIVRRYLEALESYRPGRGRKRTIESIEAEFMKVAAAYSRRKGISYQAWRIAGVQPRVLRAAGIERSR